MADSVPSTAAAPHIALPTDVSRVIPLSIFSSRPMNIPPTIVTVTTIASITTACKPTSSTFWNVRRKPYRMMPRRSTRFEQNCMPGTHVAGRLLRRLLA